MTIIVAEMYLFKTLWIICRWLELSHWTPPTTNTVWPVFSRGRDLKPRKKTTHVAVKQMVNILTALPHISLNHIWHSDHRTSLSFPTHFQPYYLRFKLFSAFDIQWEIMTASKTSVLCGIVQFIIVSLYLCNRCSSAFSNVGLNEGLIQNWG